MHRGVLIGMLFIGCSTLVAQEPIPQPVLDAGDRFAVVETDGSVVMLETGDSWFLDIREQEVVWLPLRRVASSR